ncbi:MAG: DUF948 domain-containing protein [Mycoplasmatales bacterium]
MNILFGLLIIAIIILILVLVKVLLSLANSAKEVEKILRDNKRSVDISILELSKSLEETSTLLKTINLKERELRESMDNVQTITKDISKITTTAANIVEKGADVVSTTSEAMKNFNTINNMFKKEKKGDKDAN